MFLRSSVEVGPSEKNGSEMSVEASASFLRKHLPYEPEIGVICGSGLGFLAEDIDETFELPYSSIPNFPTCTVEGHNGKLILGRIDKIPLLFMQGRVHYYEGYPLWKCTLPVRVMNLLNIKALIITNSSGAVNKLYKKGDVMVIEDHIDLLRLLGNFSIVGPPDNLFNFNCDPNQRIYDKDLIKHGIQIGRETLKNHRVHKGVYGYSAGPNYGSNAELKCLQRFGADVVGSSSVHEAIVTKSCGMSVFGFSLVATEYRVDSEKDVEIGYEEVLEVARENRDVLREFLRRIVKKVEELKVGS